jgi:AraC-like DNA-binding protein
MAKRIAVPVDRLDALLKRFSLSAQMFHHGPLCGTHDFTDLDTGYLHLVRSGTLRVQHKGQRPLAIREPTLLFYPLPLVHRFISDEVGADMTCASVEFVGGADNPIARALPAFLALPLSQTTGLRDSVDLLFNEAATPRCGRGAIINRLFEVVLIQLLRELLERDDLAMGLIAGLAHPQLRKALIALHAKPENNWSLEALAKAAGQSRTVFAQTFREVVGTTPGDYVSDFRISVAQDLLRKGHAAKLVAQEVGYGSNVAFSRVFKNKTGLAPGQWLARQDV